MLCVSFYPKSVFYFWPIYVKYILLFLTLMADIRRNYGYHSLLLKGIHLNVAFFYFAIYSTNVWGKVVCETKLCPRSRLCGKKTVTRIACNVKRFKRKHKAKTPPILIYISNSHFLHDLEWALATTAGIHLLHLICVRRPSLHPLTSGARGPATALRSVPRPVTLYVYVGCARARSSVTVICVTLIILDTF